MNTANTWDAASGQFTWTAEEFWPYCEQLRNCNPSCAKEGSLAFAAANCSALPARDCLVNVGAYGKVAGPHNTNCLDWALAGRVFSLALLVAGARKSGFGQPGDDAGGRD